MPQRYEVRHQGPAIICGSAPSVFVDLEKARQARPSAVILGVNEVAGIIDGIEHIWTQHNNMADRFRLAAKSHVYVHARAGILGEVDYWWPELAGMKGSSGMVGALWARAMGFDEVIMVGIPLSTSETKYSEKYPGASRTKDFATEASILGWQKAARQHKESGRTQGIYSMSGYTKKLFGPVPGLED
jgi:hypothetical protein